MYQLHVPRSVNLRPRSDKRATYTLENHYVRVPLQSFIEACLLKKKYSTVRSRGEKNKTARRNDADVYADKLKMFNENWNVTVEGKGTEFSMANLASYKTRAQVTALLSAVLLACGEMPFKGRAMYWKMLRQTKSSLFPNNRHHIEHEFRRLFREASAAAPPGDIARRTEILLANLRRFCRDSLASGTHERGRYFIFTVDEYEQFTTGVLNKSKQRAHGISTNPDEAFYERVLDVLKTTKQDGGLLVVQTSTDEELDKQAFERWFDDGTDVVEALLPRQSRNTANALHPSANVHEDENTKG